jgi:hypothetical protein
LNDVKKLLSQLAASQTYAMNGLAQAYLAAGGAVAVSLLNPKLVRKSTSFEYISASR